MLLAWLGVDDHARDRVLNNGDVIRREEVPCNVGQISCSIRDASVDIHLVRPMFTADAWQLVFNLVEMKKADPLWLCGMCSHDLQQEPSMACESCFNWYHLRCCGLSKAPKKKNWICSLCYQTNNVWLKSNASNISKVNETVEGKCGVKHQTVHLLAKLCPLDHTFGRGVATVLFASTQWILRYFTSPG